MSATLLPRSQAEREKQWVALTSIGAAILLTAMKLVVGLATGSLGLLSEATHSGLDLIAAIVTYFAVRISDKPADADHLYGHGKVENLSALIETLLLLATCVWIVHEAIQRLFYKHVEVEATVWAFSVILASILIDITRSRALMRVAKRHNSQALEADALHFSTDVWSSSVVLAGLILVRLGEVLEKQSLFTRADALAALGVALLVVYVSLQLGRRTIDVLLDRAPAGMVPAIVQAVRQVEGVLGCQRVRLRQSGNKHFVDLNIAVARNLPVEQSHAIAVAVEAKIEDLMPNVDVVVHTSPTRQKGETVPERIRTIAGNLGQTVHNILVHEERGQIYADLHMEVDEDMDIRQAHDLATGLEAAVRADMPGITSLNIHIESRQQRREELRNVTRFSAELIEKVRKIASTTPGIVECHEVTVRRSGSQIYLAMHCTFEDTLSIRTVHDISTDLEDRLHAEIPNLGRVLIHPEPTLEELGEATSRMEQEQMVLRLFRVTDREFVQRLTHEEGMESTGLEGCPDRTAIVVAELKGRAVSFLAYRVEGDIFHIEKILVAREYRRLGIGREMLLHARDVLAPQAGCSRIRIRTSNDNIPALRLYQKVGFHIIAIRKDKLSSQSGERPGWDEIPVRDEIELEMKVPGRDEDQVVTRDGEDNRDY